MGVSVRHYVRLSKHRQRCLRPLFSTLVFFFFSLPGLDSHVKKEKKKAGRKMTKEKKKEKKKWSGNGGNRFVCEKEEYFCCGQITFFFSSWLRVRAWKRSHHVTFHDGTASFFFFSTKCGLTLTGLFFCLTLVSPDWPSRLSHACICFSHVHCFKLAYIVIRFFRIKPGWLYYCLSWQTNGFTPHEKIQFEANPLFLLLCQILVIGGAKRRKKKTQQATTLFSFFSLLFFSGLSIRTSLW